MSEIANLSLLGWPTQALKRLSWWLLAAAALVFFAASGRAQSTASISGTVRDPTGALVPGARVTLVNQGNKATWAVKSNEEGFFVFAAVPPATYSMHVTRQGFESWGVMGIVVHPGDSLTVPKIVLRVGRADVSVTVNAEAAGVTLDSPEHSTLITSSEISRLATEGRDVSELVNILPGFVINGGTNVQNEGPGGLYGYETMGFGNGQLGSLGANGAAPQQGLVSISSDGANVIDPGDMGGQIANVNMAQVQEVKVTTADFSADQAKGPIVINAVGKSGTSQFHGSLYTYFRNSALNSNDWLSKYYNNPRPELRYFYPGATLGGPVLIPHTHFNKNKHLFFWAGFEYYGQDQPQGSTVETAFIPNAAMLGGDLSVNTLANALHLDPSQWSTNCAADYNVSPTWSNVGGDCVSPNGMTDVTGATVENGQMKYIDPGVSAIESLWPKPNRTPEPVITAGTTQYASDGVNWVGNPMQTHNGYQLHTRVDESISDSLKFYVVYNLERVNDESAMNNIYYNPGGTVPYPSPMYSYGHSHSLTLDLTKTVGSTLTNEVMASGVYFDEPEQFGNRAKAQSTGTAWAEAGYTQGYLGLNQSQWPRILDYDTGIPSLSFGYVPPGSQFLRKFDWNVKDNLTKVYKTHTLTTGVSLEQTGNNGVTLGSQVNGTMSFMRWDTCYINQLLPGPGDPTPTAPAQANLQNTIANFLMGCPLSYSQDNSDPLQNARYWELDAYVNDQWKVNPHLTLTLGIRLQHLTPWTDPHGIGMAVWNPSGLTQYVVYQDTTSNTTWPGIFWHKRNPQYTNAGVPTRALFYSPRLGLAYDLHSNGKTVFRGGWGMYVSHDPAGISAESAPTGLQTYSNPSTTTCTFGQVVLEVVS